jgi:hypothetical protein
MEQTFPRVAKDSHLRKKLLTMMSAVMLSAGSLSGTAFAATPATDQPTQAGDHGFSPEDRAAFQDARVAALKAGLKLTPAQEKAWPAVEGALRDLFKARADRAAEWREKWKDIRDKHNVIDGLRLRAQGLTARGAERRFGVLLFHVLLKPHGDHGHSEWHTAR